MLYVILVRWFGLTKQKRGVVGRYQQCIMHEVKMSRVFNYRQRCHDWHHLSFA